MMDYFLGRLEANKEVSRLGLNINFNFLKLRPFKREEGIIHKMNLIKNCIGPNDECKCNYMTLDKILKMGEYKDNQVRFTSLDLKSKKIIVWILQRVLASSKKKSQFKLIMTYFNAKN